MNQPSLRYTRVRKVRPLVRANAGDAGLDFFVPTDLTVKDLMNCQADQVLKTYGIEIETSHFKWVVGNGQVIARLSDDEGCGVDHWTYHTNGADKYLPEMMKESILSIRLKPHSRVLIPSGIRVLLEPRASMLQANNKSGVSTKKGLIFGAEVVDSPYTGEIHISVINTSCSEVFINADEKLVQFIHIPIYDTDPEEIPHELYEEIATNWGTRGSKAFGSSDKQPTGELDYEEELRVRDAQLSAE